jgi:phosphatidate phosphatase LPIN
MLYLTARGIAMAGATRDYLASISQGDEHSSLPEGPCMLSPSRLVESFSREVIRKQPEEFKIACLSDLRSLWPANHNPFYAGFGNRDSDVTSYLEVGVPSARILIINPQGEIRNSGKTYCWASYPKLLQLSTMMFPPIHADDTDPVDGGHFLLSISVTLTYDGGHLFHLVS